MAVENREQYLAWKKLVPYLYDFFTNHNLTWPSLSCRWGPEVESSSDRRKQWLYLSEQTDGSEPNKLIVLSADIAMPRVSAAETIAAWSEQGKSQFVSRKAVKTLLHPGEVNKLRELPQRPSVVITHTDAPQLYVWDLDSQPDRAGDKGAAAKQSSQADLVLEGHEDNAEFALGVSSSSQPLVASGGKDNLVLVWNVADHVTSLATPPAGDGGAPAATGGAKSGATLQAQLRLEGHTSTVEDVVWLPGSAEHLASVGDDYAVLLWDTRSGADPVLRIPDAHGAHDVHCVDWSQHRPDYLVTGAADGSVKVWDRRSPATPAFSFQHHSEAVMRVEWCPQRAGVFASGGEDRLVCIWDLDTKVAEGAEGSRRPKAPVPPQLMFQHAGHKASVVDMQWNPVDPWTLMSVSDDVREGGGGTLQLWRVSDIIYRPDEEVLAELEQYREYIISGDEAKLPHPSHPQASQQPQRADSTAAISEQAPANGSSLEGQSNAGAEGARAVPAEGEQAQQAQQVQQDSPVETGEQPQQLVREPPSPPQ